MERLLLGRTFHLNYLSSFWGALHSINIPISTVGVALVKSFVATFLFAYTLALPIVVLGLPVMLFGTVGKVTAATVGAMLGMSPNGLMIAAGIFLVLWVVQALLLERCKRWMERRTKERADRRTDQH
jgi:membrane protein implicated in regulation of membrane protease activity